VAKIPGVPTLEPVNQPMMSPQEAGREGEVISQMGSETNDIAVTGLDFDLFLKKAQQNVDERAFQNQAHALVLNYQDQLSKTTNSRDVEAITKQAHDDLNSLATQTWAKSPAAVSIQMQATGLAPELQHLGNVKTADLQIKESAVQTNIQMQTLLPQLVDATRNGDKAQANYINGYIDHIQDGRLSAGLITQAQADIEKNAIQIQLRKQLNDAAISSADPKERQAAIAQLKSGGSGPLNLEGLAAGDIAALRTQAESTNERLNNLNEAQNLNRDLNKVQNAFAAPEYKENYEARVNSLQDGDWLQQHGIVSEDGSADRVMAEKLIAETNRQRAEWEKERSDRDDKAAEKISPLIDENKISLGELNTVLDQQEGISPKVRAQLVRQWRENTNENIRLGNESYEVKQRAKAQRSQDAYGDWMMRIAGGEIPSDADIRTTPGISKADALAALSYRDKAKADKPYQGGLTIISTAFPQTSIMAPEQQSLQHQYFLKTVQAYDQEINAHPDEDKSAIATKLVMPGIVRDAIMKSVPSAVVGHLSMWQRLTTGNYAVEGFPSAEVRGIAPTSQKTTQTFTDGGRTYRIPADQVEEFKKDHPNAR